MYKLLIDSDSLIKLAKIGLLENVTKIFSVQITEEIFNETVTEGKKRLYEDANKIEKFITNGKIIVIKKKRKGRIPAKENFGAGELSIIDAKEKKHIIVTDDLSFTRYLQSNKIIPISSANLIISLKEKSILTKQQAFNYLERLKPHIRDEIYKNIANDLEGE